MVHCELSPVSEEALEARSEKPLFTSVIAARKKAPGVRRETVTFPRRWQTGREKIQAGQVEQAGRLLCRRE